MKTRREFLRSGFALGAAATLVPWRQLAAAEPAAPPAAPRPVLVAVRNGNRAAMLDQALAALGGIGVYVKPGQTVCLKPNIGWDAPPERGANTHPELVGHLIRLCLAAGAKSVSVFDNTCDQWQRAYANSGIEQAAREAGAHVVNGKDESLYREVVIPGGVKLKTAKVHSLVLDSDVFLNVPVLKHHSGTGMTSAMKNLMGVVWDRRFYHSNNLHQTIADFLLLRKPTLNIVDAYHPMVRNGPRGKTVDDVVEMRTLLVSADPVAIDAAAAKLLGRESGDFAYIKLAQDLGHGTMDLTRVEVRRFNLA
jgi:uncharacterized protein (DUF362 family)